MFSYVCSICKKTDINTIVKTLFDTHIVELKEVDINIAMRMSDNTSPISRIVPNMLHDCILCQWGFLLCHKCSDHEDIFRRIS